ncbi:SDR family oxidoreductase [Lysinibacillus sp. KU-BSD001]|uniref:SDR family NAD(P)-dependent oxidoreductase n=1 Tax=Lysinibacillus sp. KU-BSD001 TaxID=3141328 RepID=UPI0036E4DD32
MAKLQDKVIMITGGAGGIGRGMALAMVKEGAKVVIVDLNEEAGRKTEAELQALSPDSSFIPFNLTEHDQLKGLVEQVVKKYGKLNVLVNNAHVSKQVPFLETTKEHMDLSFNTGFYPTFYLMQAAIPHLKETKGNIINFASGAGLKGHATQGSYAAAKEAIRAITRVAANEFGKDGININLISPIANSEGVRQWAEAQPEYYKEVLKSIPLGRFGDPEEDIGKVAVFLASDDCKYMTGQTFMVDGGSIMLH